MLVEMYTKIGSSPELSALKLPPKGGGFAPPNRRQSNVETAFSMIKGKFGDAVRSKSDIGQLNEVLCKVLCHNLCVIIQAIHELGIEPTFHGAAKVPYLS
jgi:hypothetical protein